MLSTALNMKSNPSYVKTCLNNREHGKQRERTCFPFSLNDLMYDCKHIRDFLNFINHNVGSAMSG